MLECGYPGSRLYPPGGWEGIYGAGAVQSSTPGRIAVKCWSNCRQKSWRLLDGGTSWEATWEGAPMPWHFGPFRLDLTQAGLWRAEQPVPLRPKTLALLAYLV